MKKILIFLLTLSFSTASSQIYTSRIIEVEPGQMENFVKAAGENPEI